MLTPWPDDAERKLGAAADVLFDLEKVRIASENRLRQFIRPADEEDKDGRYRGFGWTIEEPAVVHVAVITAGLNCHSEVVKEATGTPKPRKFKGPEGQPGCCLEHDAERELERALRRHPLGPWIAAQKGIGPKQGARMLASLGDPYIRPEMKLPDGTVEPSRPRTVSELWAYCGYHVLKDGHAAKRAKGERANWSSAAKMRTYLVAEKCMQSGLDKRTCSKADDDDYATHAAGCQCSPYRIAYDLERVKLADAVHADACARCGPAGKPAQPGSPLSLNHKKARALRKVAKEILKDLWREAKRLHETPVSDQSAIGTQVADAADGED